MHGTSVNVYERETRTHSAPYYGARSAMQENLSWYCSGLMHGAEIGFDIGWHAALDEVDRVLQGLRRR